MQFILLILSSLSVLSIAQPWGGDSEREDNGGDNGPFSLDGFIGGMGGDNEMNFVGGPSFLWNVTRQARQEYYKIFQNKTLTRAQIQTAVGNWSTSYNLVAEVNDYNSNKQSQKTELRANVTVAVQQLPTLITQLNAIDDNLNLTPSQAAKETMQTIHNATLPLLRDLAFDVVPPSAFESSFDDDDDSSDESSEEIVVVGF